MPVIVWVTVAVAIGSSTGEALSQAPSPGMSRGVLELVSVDDEGEQPFYVVRTGAALSPSGRYVAFTTGGRGIHGVPTVEHVLVRDLESGDAWTVRSEESQVFMRVEAVTDDGMVLVSTTAPLVSEDEVHSPDDLYAIGRDGTITWLTQTSETVGPPHAVSLSGDVEVLAEGDPEQLVVRSGDARSVLSGAAAASCLRQRCTVNLVADGSVAVLNLRSSFGQTKPHLVQLPTDLSGLDRVHVGPSWGGEQAPTGGRFVASVESMPEHSITLTDQQTGVVTTAATGGPAVVNDVSEDGQFVLVTVDAGTGHSQVQLIDVGSGEVEVVATNNLAEGLAISDLGSAVMWGDQSEANSRLFLQRYDHRCDVVAGERRVGVEMTLCASGRVVASIEGQPRGSASWQAPRGGVEVLVDGRGWHVADPDGYILPHGGSDEFVGVGGLDLVEPIVDLIGDVSSGSVWQVAADGGVFTLGDSRFFGSAGAIALVEPIVAAMAMPGQDGYWLVASDGGVFTFGSARFLGSMGGVRLAAPVVAGRATSTGEGYWLAASDGGVFTFGDADFLGSAAGLLPTDEAVVDMGELDGGGYWLLTSRGRFIDFVG